MAPKKRRTDDEGAVKPHTSSRVTRSSARRSSDNKTADSVVATAELPTKKKAKTMPEIKKEERKEKSEASPVKVADGAKTIVIEHCKQCNSFKTRAVQVKNGLESGLSGFNVLLNPDKPRRGCFEIRMESGAKFISLLDMKRPFKPMKELDMDKVISDIIDKLK